MFESFSVDEIGPPSLVGLEGDHSFIEQEIKLKHDPASDYTKRREYISKIYDNARKEMEIPKVGKFQTEFLKFQKHMNSKIDPFEIIIENSWKFPFKIFDSDLL